ncbi:MAG: YafY family transcriptional regulator [Clostridiales bacterium]|nr:YafY family transcriptional regulator [Clostridiales bacterium]
MKIERLLAITNYLLSHKRVTAQMLAGRFGVSTRTVMRDINTLSLAGIPVVTFYGVDGGYEILDSFKMERQLVDASDHSYIITALQGLQSAFEHNELEDTLEKMQAIAPDCETQMVLDFSTLKENRSTNEKLLLLQQAINRCQKVAFSYTNANNEEKQHVVEPVATMYKWYSWYLLCYCPRHEDYRIFKLVRMGVLSITNQKNSKTHNVSEAKRKWEQSEQKQDKIRVRLLCKSIARARCEEYLNGTAIKEFDNKDFMYDFHVPAGEHFWYGTVLALGSTVRVIEPTDLIEKIRLNCNEILKLYEEV